jgi:Fur family transcriptional regulator, ferric uptake regulator
MESKELRRAGLKVTLPRLKILEILEANQQRHMSAEDVYKHLIDSDADIGLATVYRVLTQFEAAGLVRRHNFEGGSAVFELDDGGHHDHIICQQCGRVEEFYDPTIEARQEAAAQAHGFTVADHALVIYGNCARKDCPHLANKD